MNKNFIAQAKFDFHDLDNIDPYEIELCLYRFIQKNYNHNLKKLLVITGKGKVVKPIVRMLLKNHELVIKFSEAGYYNGQGGAFEVILKG